MISSPLLAVVNHLLMQEPWARDKLASHLGKVACLDFGLGAVSVRVIGDGTFEAADSGQAPNVRIRVRPADLPLILQDRERAFSYVTVEGDADFANTLSQLGQTLRWEAEEDLSRWVGDIAATRLVAGARAAFGGARSVQQKLVENFTEYFLEENPMLIRKPSVAEFCDEVTRLRDDCERLAKRIEKLK